MSCSVLEAMLDDLDDKVLNSLGLGEGGIALLSDKVLLICMNTFFDVVFMTWPTLCFTHGIHLWLQFRIRKRMRTAQDVVRTEPTEEAPALPSSASRSSLVAQSSSFDDVSDEGLVAKAGWGIDR